MSIEVLEHRGFVLNDIFLCGDQEDKCISLKHEDGTHLTLEELKEKFGVHDFLVFMTKYGLFNRLEEIEAEMCEDQMLKDKGYLMVFTEDNYVFDESKNNTFYLSNPNTHDIQEYVFVSVAISGEDTEKKCTRVKRMGAVPIELAPEMSIIFKYDVHHLKEAIYRLYAMKNNLL